MLPRYRDTSSLCFGQSDLTGMQCAIGSKTCTSNQGFETVNEGGISPRCRNTKDPFYAHVGPSGDAHAKMVCNVGMDGPEKVIEPSLRLFTGQVGIVVLVVRVQIEFEMLGDV